jgi:hypothetical protein
VCVRVSACSLWCYEVWGPVCVCAYERLQPMAPRFSPSLWCVCACARARACVKPPTTTTTPFPVRFSLSLWCVCVCVCFSLSLWCVCVYARAWLREAASPHPHPLLPVRAYLLQDVAGAERPCASADGEAHDLGA